MKIKLYDRVRLDGGQIGTIVYDDRGFNIPLAFLADRGSEITWLERDGPRVTEIIGHRYFVDTPFTVGETYETGDGHKETIFGVGLICKSPCNAYSHRKPDGTHSSVPGWSLTPPTPKSETRKITLDLTEEEIAQMSGVIPRLRDALEQADG